VTRGSAARGILFFAPDDLLRSLDVFFFRPCRIFFPPLLGACSQAGSLAVRSNGYRKERFRVRCHNFDDAFLWLNRQSSSFNDAFRVEDVKLAMYLLFLRDA